MTGMGILRFFLITIEVLSAFLLIVIILMQRSKSQGMGVAFGGGMGETLFGSQMGNVLTKTTVILAIIFLGNTTFLAIVKPTRGHVDSLADKVSAEAPMAPQQMPTQSNFPDSNQPVPSAMDMNIPAQQPAVDVTIPAPLTSDQIPVAAE